MIFVNEHLIVGATIFLLDDCGIIKIKNLSVILTVMGGGNQASFHTYILQTHNLTLLGELQEEKMTPQVDVLQNQALSLTEREGKKISCAEIEG